MKRTISILLLASVTAFTGCELLMPKKGNQDDGGGSASNDGGGGADASQYVKAPGQIWISGSAAQGYELTVEATSGGQTSTTWTAIVGDTGSAWLVEYSYPGLSGMVASFPELEGQILGLTVNKEDGKVTAAVLGKAGEKGKAIGINDIYDAPDQPTPEGVDEDVTIGLGSFPSKKMEAGGQTSWGGTQGELKGVLLKTTGPGGDYELSEMPSAQSADLGSSVSFTRLTYSNGMVMDMTTNEVVLAFAHPDVVKASEMGWVALAMKAESYETKATKVGTDAKAQLTWE